MCKYSYDQILKFKAMTIEIYLVVGQMIWINDIMVHRVLRNT